ncbi:ATP-binding protein [Alphaproteobacteria bacterium]|nr:ATP-binding protein [Alphaproteobacteria bacterium]
MNYSLNNLLKQKSFFISITFSFVIIMFVYFNFFKFDKLNNFHNVFILSLVLFFVLFSFLTFFIVNRISFFYQNYKLKKTGQELQKKILLIFATIVMTPTLLIAFFSIFIFDTALSGWFNKKISTAISQSVEVANQYLEEHQSAMRGDILELVNIINSNSNNLSSDKIKFNKFLDKYTLSHNLSEAVIIDSIGNVLAFSQFVFEYTYADIPADYYNLANKNEIIISKEENSNKLRAFIKLSQFVDAYLLITRFVDERVLNAIESTSIAASDYQSIELKTLDIKISFIVIFILITIILLLSSLIIGLSIANRLLNPITLLIKGAEEVGGGNLDYKIPKSILSKININEIKTLAVSFNLMISDLKSNRVDLEYANDQLDKRRKFSESVLSGVYSGVIGLNKNLEINLPNITASNLLGISIEKDYGKPIIEIVPEFKNLINLMLSLKQNVIEEKISIIRDDKVLNLITRLVVQKSENTIIGYVITFDDVTNLIAAQKMAAWSDVARRIAHEIKNPLTPIRLSSERLIKKLNNDSHINKELFKNSLTMINKQVDDIDHLVNEFSSFARMPSPKLKVINLSEIIFDFIQPLIPSFPYVVFKLDQPKKNALIMGDEKQIRQACGNLIKNSYENIFLNKIENGEICILFEVKNSFVIVSINDNGTGISKSHISEITEPYFTTKEGGTGLGLAITKKIIEDHNGTFLIKSIKKPRLTSVVFKIPLKNKVGK